MVGVGTVVWYDAVRGSFEDFELFPPTTGDWLFPDLADDVELGDSLFPDLAENVELLPLELLPIVEISIAVVPFTDLELLPLTFGDWLLEDFEDSDNE